MQRTDVFGYHQADQPQPSAFDEAMSQPKRHASWNTVPVVLFLSVTDH